MHLPPSVTGKTCIRIGRGEARFTPYGDNAETVTRKGGKYCGKQARYEAEKNNITVFVCGDGSYISSASDDSECGG